MIFSLWTAGSERDLLSSTGKEKWLLIRKSKNSTLLSGNGKA